MNITPIEELHSSYQKKVTRKPYTGAHAHRPQHQGLTSGVLHGMYHHYHDFIQEYSMHYIVGSIVRPLTEVLQSGDPKLAQASYAMGQVIRPRSEDRHYVFGPIEIPFAGDPGGGISFAQLWGGRTVKHFVSHCWNTSFAHFYKTICAHSRHVVGERRLPACNIDNDIVYLSLIHI